MYLDHIQFIIVYNISITFIELIIWLFEQFDKMFPWTTRYHQVCENLDDKT